MMMKASNILIEALKGFEGCRLTSYQDSKGVWTIGIGHTRGVKKGQVITPLQAEMLLQSDLSTAEKYVNALGVAKTQGEYDALVDFVYNLGSGALAGSTLLKYIKLGKPTVAIQAEFCKWNKCRINGKLVELNGLTRRRKWESKRYAEI